MLVFGSKFVNDVVSSSIGVSLAKEACNEGDNSGELSATDLHRLPDHEDFRLVILFNGRLRKDGDPGYAYPSYLHENTFLAD